MPFSLGEDYPSPMHLHILQVFRTGAKFLPVQFAAILASCKAQSSTLCKFSWSRDLS
jgi:hypothetical protein